MRFLNAILVTLASVSLAALYISNGEWAYLALTAVAGVVAVFLFVAASHTLTSEIEDDIFLCAGKYQSHEFIVAREDDKFRRLKCLRCSAEMYEDPRLDDVRNRPQA